MCCVEGLWITVSIAALGACHETSRPPTPAWRRRNRESEAGAACRRSRAGAVSRPSILQAPQPQSEVAARSGHRPWGVGVQVGVCRLWQDDDAGRGARAAGDRLARLPSPRRIAPGFPPVPWRSATRPKVSVWAPPATPPPSPGAWACRSRGRGEHGLGDQLTGLLVVAGLVAVEERPRCLPAPQWRGPRPRSASGALPSAVAPRL